jgi:hypothetical protein
MGAGFVCSCLRHGRLVHPIGGKMAKTMKQIYRERKKAGVCVSCGKHKPDGEHFECAVCVAANHVYRKLKAEGKKWDRKKFLRTEIAKRALEGHYPQQK